MTVHRYQPKPCRTCTQPFTPYGPNTRYCPTCRDKKRGEPKVRDERAELESEPVVKSGRIAPSRKRGVPDPRNEAILHLRKASIALRAAGYGKTAAVVEVFAKRFE